MSIVLPFTKRQGIVVAMICSLASFYLLHGGATGYIYRDAYVEQGPMGLKVCDPDTSYAQVGHPYGIYTPKVEGEAAIVDGKKCFSTFERLDTTLDYRNFFLDFIYWFVLVYIAVAVSKNAWRMLRSRLGK